MGDREKERQTIASHKQKKRADCEFCEKNLGQIVPLKNSEQNHYHPPFPRLTWPVFFIILFFFVCVLVCGVVVRQHRHTISRKSAKREE